jgi:hypothetical protein
MFCELELPETLQQNIISFGQLREERAREREKRNGEVGAKTHNTRSIGPNLAFPLLKLLPRFSIFFTLNFAGLPKANDIIGVGCSQSDLQIFFVLLEDWAPGAPSVKLKVGFPPSVLMVYHLLPAIEICDKHHRHHRKHQHDKAHR